MDGSVKTPASASVRITKVFAVEPRHRGRGEGAEALEAVDREGLTAKQQVHQGASSGLSGIAGRWIA